MRLIFWIICLVLIPGAIPALAAGNAPGAQPKAVTVVPEAEVRRVIGDYLVQRTVGLGAEITVKGIGYQGELQLPPGKVSYEVIAPQSWEGWGTASLALVVRVDGQVKKNLPVRVEVEALVEMVLATRTLERGEVIGAADLSLGKRDLAKMGGRFCRNPEELVGKRVKTALRANSPVRQDYLENLPLVKSGQMVTVLLESDTLRITASGKAKVGGALGDLITVQNPSSMKEFTARVVSPGTVQVEY